MKKLWMLLLALLVTGAVLVSCQTAGNSGETDTDPMTDAVTETEVVTDPVAETETETETEADNFLIGGEPLQNYTVIYAADATASQLTAIRDMIDLVAGATGVTLPKLTDAESAEYEIVIGTTTHDTEAVINARNQVTDDGYAMLVDGGDLYITAPIPRGTLCGVYDFLEKYVGVYLYVGIEHFPVQSGLTRTELYEIKDNYGWKFLPT